MFKKLISRIILSGCSLLLFSCSTTVNEAHESPAAEPTEMSIKSNLILDITDTAAANLKIPSKLKGDLQIKVTAEVIRNKPLRSHFSSDISIVFSDILTSQKYLDFQTIIEGNADGSPNEGISEAFKRFMNVIMILTNSSDNVIKQNVIDSEK
ncbi:MAG: hypothetical protein JW787_08620 [Sedimentisphaerales bacterium]|nr:hypothetical protein [Sedimentisphaerales bacterium]